MAAVKTALHNDEGGGGLMMRQLDLFPRPPRTAYDLYRDENHMRHVSFGCPILDDTFGGGLPGHGVVEISGMAGSGKTQLMLQLLVQQVRNAEEAWRQANYATPFIAGRSFYLSTEGPLPAKRLADMAAAACPTDSGFAQRVLESVIIIEAKNVEDQLYILTTQLPTLLADANLGIRLCVVDSMSALFRGEFSLSKNDTLDRAKMVFAMAKQMKKLSHDFSLPFVCTNQVTADFAATYTSSVGMGVGVNGGLGEQGGGGVNGGVQPALGLSWSNCVHTRFLLTRRDVNNGGLGVMVGGNHQHQQQQQQQEGGSGGGGGGGGGGLSQWVRQMRLVLSPTLAPNVSCRFVVETAGVRGLRELDMGE